MNDAMSRGAGSASGGKKIWIIVLAALIVIGGGIWSYKAGVFKNVVEKKTTTGSSLTYKGVQGKTALDLLKGSHKVETQLYSGNEFVKSIDGVTPDSNHYWSFTVNGSESTVGAGQYVTKDGDAISWELKAINSKL